MFPDDDIFIDQSKAKAKKWREENDKKLNECDLVLLIITPAALKSDEVEREVATANDLNKLILPCKMNATNLDWRELKWNINSSDGIEFDNDEELLTILYGAIDKIIKEHSINSKNISELSSDMITVNVDRHAYSDGDKIIISGKVKELLSNTPVNLRIVSPHGQLISLAQLEIDSDKKYCTEFTSGGFFMANEGMYSVIVQYGKSRTATATFYFEGSSGISKYTTTENTITPEGTNFSLNYNIKNAKIISVVNDLSTSSLIVCITPTDNGEITLTIPRSLLDARLDDEDVDFFVLVDGEEITFNELRTDNDRTLTIQFPSDSKEIEIIGLPNSSKAILPVFPQSQSPHEHGSKTHIISISVAFDRTVYPVNSKIYVRVNCPDIIFRKPINLEIVNSNNVIIDSKQIDPITHPDSDLKQAGIYQEFFNMNSINWKLGEVYTIRASHGNAMAVDTCTVDERTPVIQTDKSVYLSGTDMILTVIDPDADKDSQKVEIIGDSPESFLTISSSIGKIEGYKLRETGDSTGIFQGIIGLIGTFDNGTAIPYVNNDKKISKTQGSGIDDGFLQVKHNDEIKITYKRKSDATTLTAFSSNFGAMIELDQKVYTWTDKIHIAVVAPSFIKDPSKVESIGNNADGVISIRTRMGKLENYELIETGPGTGIFIGEIRLAGFQYDKIPSDAINSFSNTSGEGPRDGILPCDSEDGISIEFKTKTESVVGSALIRWNIGEIHWMTDNYLLGSNGTIRVIDPDMNLDPNMIDVFKIRVWSDSDPVGTEIIVVETDPATGIFVGDILFDTKTEDSISLKVSPGDTVVAEYVDFTLPHPYKKGDSLIITSTLIIEKT